VTRQDCELFIELAELVRSDVSGPLKRKMVAKAQKRLVKQLERNGVLSVEEADALSV
jgi:hypothetical protein